MSAKAKPSAYTVKFDQEYEEYQVHYRYRGKMTFCPAADYQDALGTAALLAKKSGAEVVDRVPQRYRRDLAA